jgi:hypothetical protein
MRADRTISAAPSFAGWPRTKPSHRRRQRILNDEELTAVWRASEASQSVFGHLLQYPQRHKTN